MKRFARLFQELDRTTKTNPKVDALEAYFREAPSADAAWGLFFLTGNRIKRAVGTARFARVGRGDGGTAAVAARRILRRRRRIWQRRCRW